MLAFAGMLVEAAEQAGIPVPEDVDNFDQNKYPHFGVFCKVQLCRPVRYHGEHWENAKVIAGISEEEIRKVTLTNLIEKGLSW
jgi:hypothetical protein